MAKQAIINFNMHQPLRLSPERASFLWTEKNRQVFKNSAQHYYMPILEVLSEALVKHPSFKFNMGMSGTFLEQAKEYAPALMDLLKGMIRRGSASGQVELLGETFHNSLAEFFSDPTEFNEQVAMQKDWLKEEFGMTPLAYRHTKRPFSDFVGTQLRNNKYKIIITDIAQQGFTKSAYRLQGTDDVLVLKRAIGLSHLLSRNYLNPSFTLRRLFWTTDQRKAGAYLDAIQKETDPVVLSYALGRVGTNGFKGFWDEFAKQASSRLELLVASDLYATQDLPHLPEISIPTNHAIDRLSDWETAKYITNGLIDTKAKFDLFKQIEQLFDFPPASLSSEEKRKRSVLTAYSHFRFLDSTDDSPDIRSNPYGNPVDATFQFTRKIDDLEHELKKEYVKFEILRRTKKDIFLTASPELGTISSRIAPQGAVPINAFGGMAIVASSTANYLADQGFDSRILTLDMTKNYDKNARDQFRQELAAKMHVHEEKIYLVRSFSFEGIKNPYNDVPKEFLAAEAQNYAMKYVFPELLKEDRSIAHIYHDQVFGGVSAGSFRHTADELERAGDKRQLRNVQYSHNVHSAVISMDNFKDLPPEVRERYIYYGPDGSAESLLTGVMDGHGIIMVAPNWLKEVKDRKFPNLVPEAFAREIDIKDAHGQVFPILNGLPKDRYPEHADCLKHPSLYFPGFDADVYDLISPFGPESDFLFARRSNKMAFQKIVGLKPDPAAIVVKYSGRVDFIQKQSDTLMEIIPYLQKELANQGITMQFVMISNPVNDKKVLDAYWKFGAMAYASQGSIALQPFSLPLEILGTSSDVDVGTSRSEMCGLNDELALMHGALPAYTATGGLEDKLVQYAIAGYHPNVARTSGNGVVFGTDHNSIWFGIKKAVELAYHLQQNPALQRELAYDRMVHAREDLSVEKQGKQFVAALNTVFGRDIK